MRRVLAAGLLAGLAASPAHAAGSALLGGFLPVAVEDGARAAWTCPAAVASRRNPQFALEAMFREDADGSYGQVSAWTLAASAPGRAYGFQFETKDTPGVADWTLAAARVIGGARGPRLGSTVEWRGGDENTFDALLGAFAPVGRNLRAAVSVENVFGSDIDGVATERTWRGGLAARGRHAYASWDWRGEEHARGLHIFGLGVATRFFAAGGALDEDGGWSADLRLILDTRSAGAGASRPDGGRGNRFATIELGS